MNAISVETCQFAVGLLIGYSIGFMLVVIHFIRKPS